MLAGDVLVVHDAPPTLELPELEQTHAVRFTSQHVRDVAEAESVLERVQHPLLGERRPHLGQHFQQNRVTLAHCIGVEIEHRVEGQFLLAPCAHVHLEGAGLERGPRALVAIDGADVHVIPGDGSDHPVRKLGHAVPFFSFPTGHLQYTEKYYLMQQKYPCKRGINAYISDRMG